MAVFNINAETYIMNTMNPYHFFKVIIDAYQPRGNRRYDDWMRSQRVPGFPVPFSKDTMQLPSYLRTSLYAAISVMDTKRQFVVLSGKTKQSHSEMVLAFKAKPLIDSSAIFVVNEYFTPCTTLRIDREFEKSRWMSQNKISLKTWVKAKGNFQHLGKLPTYPPRKAGQGINPQLIDEENGCSLNNDIFSKPRSKHVVSYRFKRQIWMRTSKTIL